MEESLSPADIFGFDDIKSLQIHPPAVFRS